MKLTPSYLLLTVCIVYHVPKKFRRFMYLLQSFLILLFNLDTVELTENCVQHLRLYSVYWLAFCHASYKTRSQAVTRIAYRTASQHLPFDTTYVIFYWWSFATESLPPAVFEGHVTSSVT